MLPSTPTPRKPNHASARPARLSSPQGPTTPSTLRDEDAYASDLSGYALDLYHASLQYNTSHLFVGTNYNALLELYLAASHSGRQMDMDSVHTVVLQHLQCVAR